MAQSPESPSDPAESPKGSRTALMRNGLFFLICTALIAAAVGTLWKPDPQLGPENFDDREIEKAGVYQTAAKVNAAFAKSWSESGIDPAPRASDLAVARRLSLALTGTIPSLEDLRTFEKQPEELRIQWWLTRLFEDRRFSDYVAERLARAVVGVENGPFIVFRRGKMVSWLSDELFANRPYDELIRKFISAEGVWTSHPEANFVTVTIDPNNGEGGPDEIKLAARTTRAFLGVRIDCMQCHDDKFGDRWKQEDFHQLAAFFAGAEMKLSGVRDNINAVYETRFRGEPKEETVLPIVPFQGELLPPIGTGTLRERLAVWATHPENRAFARATVNRFWALLFNKPLVDPIDDIPLDGPYPPGLEILADDLIENGFDIQRLVRTIAATEIYQLDSRSHDPDEPVTTELEESWAAFPLTRLRPEQMASSVIQSASVHTIDNQAHVITRAMRFGGQNDFIRRYGDIGQDEFGEQSGTIPQRLLMMNGKLVKDRTAPNPVINAATRMAFLAPDDETAIESAYLGLFSRRPTDVEANHFKNLLSGKTDEARNESFEDLFWTLLNATEFSWNH